MAIHAHSTRTPLLPLTAARPPLLRRGPSPQLGPVTLAIRAMREAPADRAIRELREGLERHFADVGVAVDLDAPLPAGGAA